MSKIRHMLAEKVISGFKGVIDYYYYMGIACVRRWPRSPGRRRAPAVEAQWPAFGYAAYLWNNLTPEIRDTYIQNAQESTMTGRDLFMKSYISDYFREGQWE